MSPLLFYPSTIEIHQKRVFLLSVNVCNRKKRGVAEAKKYLYSCSAVISVYLSVRMPV